MPDSRPSSIRDEALGYLRMLQRVGFVVLPAGEPSASPEASKAAPRAPTASTRRVVAPTARQSNGQLTMDLFAPAGGRRPDLSIEEKARKLAEIAAEVAQCRKCALCQSRTNTVPGEGSPNAKLVFVGEAPGYYEDVRGRPFVGRAGELLDKMIEAMRLHRRDVFICNVIKCRPPENRNPTPEEMRACEGYLLRQLEALSPSIIVSLGNLATQCLLATREPISRLRGQWREFHGIALMPTYHPAYLLRNPGDKRKCWEDLQKAMAEYERTVGPLPPA